MKRMLALLLCVLLAASSALAEGAAILDGRWLCADIRGSVTQDTPADLKDDFALYVNKDWILGSVIPDGESSTGSFEEADRTLKDRQIALLKDESLTGHDAELVRNVYRLVTDWDYRNAQGVEPAMREINAIRAIDSLQALTGYLSTDTYLCRYFLVQPSVSADLIDPSVYITQIAAPSLMLQDSAEYAQRTQAGEIYYTVGQRVARYMLERMGFSEAEAGDIIENAFAFEALLAEHIKPMATHYQADYFASLLNYYSPEELQALAGDYPILDMIRAYGLKVGQRFRVAEPEYIAALPDIFVEENVPLMRDWMTMKAARAMADSLDQETDRQTRAIVNEVYGVSGETDADDTALTAVKSMLAVPMDNLYIQAYCTERQREDILRIIDETLATYRAMLEANGWLSEETRAQAIEKLDAIHVNAVYPDELGDWSALEIAGPEEGGTLLAAYNSLTNFLLAIASDRIDTAVDKTKWDQAILPTTQANAYYDPQRNSINIMAGILSGNLYNEDMSYEQMLGGIGFVIGHEISHAFDTNGAQFDKDGSLANWWTEADYAAFQERAAKLAAWYDGFIPMEGLPCSGQMVQTEAIADMGGMKCLLAIAAQKEDFDYDAFFRQYAALWRHQMLPSMATVRIAQDTHPLRYLRINATLAQYDEFDQFYGIGPGDGMYIAPEDRVAVW